MLSFATIKNDVIGFLASLPNDVRLALVGLGHIAPQLTQAASVAEMVTGNAELVPLTQAAGTAAETLGQAMATQTNTTAGVSQIAKTVSDVAETAGATTLAADANPVKQVADAAVGPSADPVTAAAA